MKKLASILFLVGAIATARATTVIPPSFDQLVSQAETIFEGSVTNVRSEWTGEGAQRYIVSYITFKVDDSIKGDPGQNYVMRMMGGTVGEETMGVSDAPKFSVGQHEILFVENNGTQFIPLVGIMHGRFHLEADDTGTEIVKLNDGTPLASVAQVGKERTAKQAERPMTAQSFKDNVRQTLAAQSGAAR
ncbi:MAG: hypothetical protein M3R59_09260 [Verrucomicrobiota bacterium]|nr:hypothetical protein [Verrucomicrobiota bacterium]